MCIACVTEYIGPSLVFISDTHEWVQLRVFSLLSVNSNPIHSTSTVVCTFHHKAAYMHQYNGAIYAVYIVHLLITSLYEPTQVSKTYFYPKLCTYFVMNEIPCCQFSLPKYRQNEKRLFLARKEHCYPFKAIVCTYIVASCANGSVHFRTMVLSLSGDSVVLRLFAVIDLTEYFLCSLFSWKHLTL